MPVSRSHRPDPQPPDDDGPDAHQPIFLTRREVADMLGVSIEWVRDHIEAGDLPCFRLGSSVRVLAKDLTTYLESVRTPAQRDEHFVNVSELPIQRPHQRVFTQQNHGDTIGGHGSKGGAS